MSEHGVRLSTLLTVGLLVLAVTAAITKLWVNAGNLPMAVPIAAMVVLVLLGAAVLRLGWALRGYQRGTRPHVDMLRAARTLALAQAAALTGAGLIGFYAGTAVGLLPDWDLRAYQNVLWHLLLGAVAASWVLGSGMRVQSWCRIPPGSDRGSEGVKPSA